MERSDPVATNRAKPMTPPFRRRNSLHPDDVTTSNLEAVQGLIFAIDQTAVHDGPGLRMAVYFKGCPLHCIWCHSPESISPEPELVWYETRCERCGLCIEACPDGVRSLDPDALLSNDGCAVCGTCVQICPGQGLEIKGKWVTAGSIAADAERLLPFFRRSNGGITLTGGEPMYQADFAYAVAALCKARGIHVAMETTGFTSWKKLERLTSVVDLFLFDIKRACDHEHRELTGVSNHPILSNLKRLTGSGVSVIVRVPVIPGYNGSPEQIKQIAKVSLNCGAISICLLPFNPAAAGKYSWLNRSYPLEGIKRQTDAEMVALENVAREVGLSVLPA